MRTETLFMRMKELSDSHYLRACALSGFDSHTERWDCYSREVGETENLKEDHESVIAKNIIRLFEF